MYLKMSVVLQTLTQGRRLGEVDSPPRGHSSPTWLTPCQPCPSKVQDDLKQQMVCLTIFTPGNAKFYEIGKKWRVCLFFLRIYTWL